MRATRVLGWVGLNIAIWLAASIAFGWWIVRTVDAEYLAGTRTADQGDAVMIPIMGFALVLAAALLVANLVWLAVRALRRRHQRAFT